MENNAIADRLDAFASLLDLAGASYYTARAYRRAAELIRSTPAPIEQLVRAGRVHELHGIGAGIEARLRELVETGDIEELAELERTTAPELVGFGRLVGIGPERMADLGRFLGVRTVAELRAAAERLHQVPGIGPKTAARLRAGLERADRHRPPRSLLLNRAWALAGGIAEALGGEVAGDPRRWKDTCERLAVIASRPDAEEAFASLPQIVTVLEPRLGVTVEGIPVELAVASPERYGTELFRATGPPEYVEALEPLPDAADERSLFAALGIAYRPPELRDVPDAAVPDGLLELEEIRGDLHCHTTWSDGKASVLEMGLAARDLGYDYLAICDHTRAVRVVPGLDADDVRRQGEEIAAANDVLAPFRVLRGIECDILPDGQLDLPDDVLAELEWVQASVHGGQRMPRAEMTKRVEAALRNPHVRCLSHPKGRYINRRPENELDLDRIFEVALEEKVALEVNGLPDRLDLSGEHVRDALEAGVEIVCSTDSHSIRGLGNMELSVATARRGWATAEHVVNTRPLRAIL